MIVFFASVIVFLVFYTSESCLLSMLLTCFRQVGYRWYNSHNVTPAFEFGFGLSYTNFSITDALFSKSGVVFQLTNTGARDGAAVPQLYLQFPATAGEPPKQLKGRPVLGIEKRK